MRQKRQTWQARVQDTYTGLGELRAYNRTYGIAARCGYRSAKRLWEDNPIIGGSVNPADFGLANPPAACKE